MSSANLSQVETAARAAAVQVHSYTVDVDIRDARDPGRPTFPVTSTIELSVASTGSARFDRLNDPGALSDPRNASTGSARFDRLNEPGALNDPGVLNEPLWIDFIGEVDSLTIDGEPHPVHHDGARLQLPDVAPGRHTVVVAGRARYSRTGEGLHRFVDPADGETYLYTQYEPADARRVFPNFEQPDLRAPFTFILTGPEEWWLGSNQPEASREAVADGVVRVTYESTGVLSTYITCICAGPYHREVDAWGEMELGLLCRRSLVRYLDADVLFTYTKQGLDWFTANFGDYPWGPKYDQIFVPEYNLGAMENPGLVTFTESYLFRSPATPAQLQARCNTLVHEMSHMWFGDLVTCRWWGDLWLKESFAEFSGSHVSHEACGFDDAWVNFAANRKASAYLADSMPTTHPVIADIGDLEAAKTNFDRITYSKGSSALTQLVHYVGLDAFLAGSRRYFSAHAHSSATLTDFIGALAQETDRDLSGWVTAWLGTAGHDTLAASVTLDGDAVGTLSITRTVPEEYPADRPHATTVGLYRVVDGSLQLERRLDVTVDAATVDVPGAVGLPAPDAVLINDRDHTFAAVALDETTRATLVAHLGDLEPIARAVAWTGLRTSLRSGDLSAEDFVDAVLGAGETQTGVLASLVAWAFDAVDRFTTDTATLAARWRDGARAAALAAAPGSPEQLIWARAYLRAETLAGGDVSWVQDGGIPGLQLSVDVTWAAWQTRAALGAATPAELDAALAADDTAAGRLARLTCWAATPDGAVKQEAWDRVHVVDGDANATIDAILAGYNTPGQSALREPLRRPYFETLLDLWRDHPIEIALRLVRGGFPDHGADEGRAWLEANPDAPGTLRRQIVEAVHEAQVAERVRATR